MNVVSTQQGICLLALASYVLNFVWTICIFPTSAILSVTTVQGCNVLHYPVYAENIFIGLL